MSSGRGPARPKFKVASLPLPSEYGFVPVSACACVMALGFCKGFVLNFFRRFGSRTRQNTDVRKGRKRSRSSAEPLWITTGFHPLLSRVGLAWAFRRFCEPAEVRCWWTPVFPDGTPPTIRGAGSNGLPSVQPILNGVGRGVGPTSRLVGRR